MKHIYRCLLTINSSIFLLVIYFIKEEIVWPSELLRSPHMSYLCYVVLAVVMSGLCLLAARFLGDETINGGIVSVESADNSYLPSYLGYFFVALSINTVDTLVWVELLILIFTYFSQTLYFNPMFLLFRYKFYYITVDTGMNFFVITKKNITSIKGLTFEHLKRINDYTFIDVS